MTLYDTRNNPLSEEASVRADDGRELRASWFRPSGEPRGAVVVVPAMATPAAFYGALAAWLAEQGFLTLTFDYRGLGSTAELRAETGDLLRWAGDAASALEALLEEVPAGVPVTWLGHSLGGQVLPFARHDLLDRVLLVASGSGYWRHNVGAVRLVAPLLWRVVVPVATRLVGYFPGRRLRMVGDLPPGVVRQWGRWCLSPDYLGVDVPDAAARYAEVTVPVSTLHFTDDELLSEASMRALEALYTGTTVESQRLAPTDLGVPRIGHHGFFRRTFRDAWEQHLLPRLATA
jgi:predicted alpha/beta hydrolase